MLIHTTKILLPILLALSVVLDVSEAKGMGKTGARLTGVRGRGSKSRNSNRYGSFGGGSSTGPDGKPINPEDAPCIGLCYHNKLLALEATEGLTPIDDLKFNRGWPLNSADFDKPCVGLCHYFRSLGMDNPFKPKPPPKTK